MQKLRSGSDVFDTFLNGGYESEVINTIYGSAGSGKTNLALLAALSAANSGTVIYIDTEGGFSPERAMQLNPKRGKEVLKNIVVLQPTTFDEQKDKFDKLEHVAKQQSAKLIVVDSISMLYRLALGSEAAYETNKEMARQLGILRKISHDLKIPIILTNQVYADFDSPGDIRMVGGDLMKYFSKCIVKLSSVDSANRKAELVKHRSSPNKTIFFEIAEDGIYEVEDVKERKRFSLF